MYLKQVGIIVYLSHIGCYIPAKKGIIGLTDKIFSRINSNESVTINESSFSIDLIQMSRMLKYCSSRSLLLIDEFGKGTKIEDGISLMGGLIYHLLEMNKMNKIPKCVIITHFMSLLDSIYIYIIIIIL